MEEADEGGFGEDEAMEGGMGDVPGGMMDEEEEPITQEEKKVDPIDYVTPDAESPYNFADAFKDTSGIGRRWILSEAKKDGADDDIAKYNGEWEIGPPDTVLLRNDYGLVLKTKARHHAISAKLDRPFTFDGKPLIAQYDVKFQNGQECGGAYIKLLSRSADLKLNNFHDKTPYTIMFGPDKCGLTSKVHFIIRYTNPKNGSINEYHAKATDKSLDEYFTDHKTHLYTLMVNPDNSYKVLIDQKEVTKGNLLETLEPPIIPEKEIQDPNDKKPADWDDREKIPDPEAKKPEDWDETAPEEIDDQDAKKPEDWLEEEPEYVDDETSTKAEDWDEEMDGKWEPAKIKNPKCEGVSGCGPWSVPKMKNPAYKGKWKAPKIPNPNFKGKWTPRIIPNPSYFEESQPYKMTPIGAVGLELWTMSDGIVFDDFLVTESKAVADKFAAATWSIKQRQENAEAAKGSVIGGLIENATERPWLWAVYLLVVLIPIVLISVFCFGGSSKDDAGKKKTDEPTPDDEGVPEEEEESEEKESSKEGTPSRRNSPRKQNKKEALEAEEDEEEEEEDSGNKKPAGSPKKGRQRKAD